MSKSVFNTNCKGLNVEEIKAKDTTGDIDLDKMVKGYMAIKEKNMRDKIDLSMTCNSFKIIEKNGVCLKSRAFNGCDACANRELCFKYHDSGLEY